MRERHSDPFRQRVKLATLHWLVHELDRLRTPIRRPYVLLVTGRAKEAKVAEVEARLRFLFSHLGRLPEFRRIRKASLRTYLSSTGVAVVDGTELPMFVRRHIPWVADLDYETNPNDGWALLDLGTALTRSELKPAVEAGREVFLAKVQTIRDKGARPSYLFGTGPSLQLAGQRSFADGTSIVCNTIVRDPDLWRSLNPAFLAAGDAIYHFGHNAHAQAFRVDALRRLKEADGRTLFVYPAPFHVVVRSEFEEVKELLVPIPWGQHTDITNDLTKRYSLPDLGNVLNALLLPLGCSISNDIRLWGFDGRAPTDSGFWSNSALQAYPELIKFIREAHPAFFAELVPEGNEFRYVKEVHGDLLEERLTEAESRGLEFRMLHPSWTPVLQRRYREEQADSQN